tara:strand:+ start:804 stop:1031 length:228 start_codon:yes stop_codon:yes gene_type:complete
MEQYIIYGFYFNLFIILVMSIYVLQGKNMPAWLMYLGCGFTTLVLTYIIYYYTEWYYALGAFLLLAGGFYKYFKE